MIALTNSQIEQIEQHLKSEGVTYRPLSEELLDHVCCLVEEEMWDNKVSFEVAFEEAVKAFDDFSFEQIQEQTLTIYISKSISMKKVMMMAAVCVVFLVFGASSSVQQEMMLEPPSIMPLTGDHVVTSGFGMRLHPIKKVKKLHRGIDFKIKTGTPILATADGVVSLAKSKPKGYGKHIKVTHNKEFETLYAHLSELKVKEGDKVKKGDVIGLSGNSGTSFKPHLHYEVLKNGKAVDPSKYFGEE